MFRLFFTWISYLVNKSAKPTVSRLWEIGVTCANATFFHFYIKPGCYLCVYINLWSIFVRQTIYALKFCISLCDAILLGWGSLLNPIFAYSIVQMSILWFRILVTNKLCFQLCCIQPWKTSLLINAFEPAVKVNVHEIVVIINTSCLHTCSASASTASLMFCLYK